MPETGVRAGGTERKYFYRFTSVFSVLYYGYVRIIILFIVNNRSSALPNHDGHCVYNITHRKLVGLSVKR